MAIDQYIEQSNHNNLLLVGVQVFLTESLGYRKEVFGANRYSKDKIVNSRGRKFINFCDSYNLVVLNGRSKVDELGKFTFIGNMGSSVNDPCSVSLNLLEHKTTFSVLPEIYSDHLPIIITCSNLNVKKKESNLFRKTESVLIKQLYLISNENYRKLLENNIKKSVRTNGRTPSGTQKIYRD